MRTRGSTRDIAERELDDREKRYRDEQVLIDTWTGSGPERMTEIEAPIFTTATSTSTSSSGVPDPAAPRSTIIFGLDAGQLVLIGIAGFAIWGVLSDG